MRIETTNTIGQIIIMEAHLFEKTTRKIKYKNKWGKPKHKEDGIIIPAYFIEHPEDKQYAHCLN
jgi:hypothetical protein